MVCMGGENWMPSIHWCFTNIWGQYWSINCCLCQLFRGISEYHWRLEVALVFVFSKIWTFAEPCNAQAVWSSSGSAWASWHFPKSFQSCREVVGLLVHTHLQHTVLHVKQRKNIGGRQATYVCCKHSVCYDLQQHCWANQRENRWNNSPLSSSVVSVYFAIWGLRGLVGMKDWTANSQDQAWVYTSISQCVIQVFSVCQQCSFSTLKPRALHCSKQTRSAEQVSQGAFWHLGSCSWGEVELYRQSHPGSAPHAQVSCLCQTSHPARLPPDLWGSYWQGQPRLAGWVHIMQISVCGHSEWD